MLFINTKGITFGAVAHFLLHKCCLSGSLKSHTYFLRIFRIYSQLYMKVDLFIHVGFFSANKLIQAVFKYFYSIAMMQQKLFWYADMELQTALYVSFVCILVNLLVLCGLNFILHYLCS